MHINLSKPLYNLTISKFPLIILLVFLCSSLTAQQMQIVSLQFQVKGSPLAGVNIQTSIAGKVSRYISNAQGQTTFPIPLNDVATVKTSMKGFRSDWMVISTGETVVRGQLAPIILELIPSLPSASADEPAGPELFYQLREGQMQLQTDDPDFSKKIALRASVQKVAQERIEQLQNKANVHRKEAEKAFAEGNYNGARDQYRRVLETFPEDVLPYYYDATEVKEAMAECNRILSREQKSNENYQLAIKTADAFFRDSDYDNAIKVYQQALQFQPSAPYALEQIEKAKELRQSQQANRMLFDLLMSSAAQAEAEKSLDRALEAYTQAQAMFPKDPDVGQRIQSLKAAIADRDRQYDATILQGDRLLQGQNFEDALVVFRNARRIKPEETYARDKIEEITVRLRSQSTAEKPDKSLAQEERNAQREREAQQKARADFDRKLAAASLSLDQNKPEEADKQLQEALAMAKQHGFETTGIDALARRLEDLQANIAQNAAYANALSQGKSALAAQRLPEALSHFTTAVEIDPREEARKLMTETRERLQHDQQTETGYQEAMATGQASIDKRQWNEATQAFENALLYKPKDEAASSKLATAKSESKRSVLVSEGEVALSADDIDLAIQKFKEAWPLQPVDENLKRRTEELEARHAENIRNRRIRYDALIAEADGKWQQKVMDEAIQKYREASALRPAEEYPKRKIREITTYLEERLVVELNREDYAIQDRSEKRFSFKPLTVRQRKNTYVIISARNKTEEELKVYLNYGQGTKKNGGIVFKVPVSQNTQDFIIRVSSQYRWYDLNNDFIGIYPEGGALEISVVQLATGE